MIRAEIFTLLGVQCPSYNTVAATVRLMWIDFLETVVSIIVLRKKAKLFLNHSIMFTVWILTSIPGTLCDCWRTCHRFDCCGVDSFTIEIICKVIRFINQRFTWFWAAKSLLLPVTDLFPGLRDEGVVPTLFVPLLSLQPVGTVGLADTDSVLRTLHLWGQVADIKLNVRF